MIDTIAGISLGVYLVVGVNHDDDVGLGLQGKPVAGLLVCPVALVQFMHVDLHPLQTSGHGHSVIAASVVHQDDRIHHLLLTHLVISLAECFGRVIGGHHHHHFHVVIHNEPKTKCLNLSMQRPRPQPAAQRVAASA